VALAHWVERLAKPAARPAAGCAALAMPGRGQAGGWRAPGGGWQAWQAPGGGWQALGGGVGGAG